MTKTAFITGATSGIGKATAELFAKNNIRLGDASANQSVMLGDAFLDDFEKWKKWKKTEGGTLDWAAEGGRIGLQTGGPPITLQRPMFNDGGLTKTIPPERGPDPQGLPSALYNGIMRPRSY